MSGFKHLVKRRVHLERGQLKRRNKLGLLEKHKDYILRAQNYHAKSKQIRNLREKGRLRNPDEFYFNMVNSKINEKGRYEKKETPTENILTNYNKNIIQMKATALSKSKDKQKEVLHLTSKPKNNFHVIYKEDSDSEVSVNSNSEDYKIIENLITQLMKSKKKLSKKNAVELARQTLLNLRATHNEINENSETAKLLKRAFEEFELRENLHKSKPYEFKKIVVPESDAPLYKWKSIRKR